MPSTLRAPPESSKPPASRALEPKPSPTATKPDLDNAVAGLRMDITAVRAELATIRWTIGMLAAFMFAIGLRVFGML